MYEKIIIGYDDSPSSLAAVREVVAWINRHGGNAEIVHGFYFDEEEFGIKPDLLIVRATDGKKSCLRAQEMAAGLGVTMDFSVREGDPPDVIINTAVEKGAGLIVLGTYGRRGIKRLLMGSVTAKVILDAPCDVLVVKNPCGECSGRYSRILVPFDGSPLSRKALDTACRLSKLDRSQVTALYVIPRYEEMMDFLKTDGVKNSLYNEAQNIMDVAREWADGQSVVIRTVIKEGSAADKTVESTEHKETDLIVMGSHGWRGIDKSIMGSTTERVIMAAPCPVLVTR